MRNQTGNYQLADDQFVKDAAEAFGMQIQNCQRYKNIIGNKTSPYDIQGPDDLPRIEPVDVDLFKASLDIFPELLNMPLENIDVFVSSGGTGGNPSLVGRRQKEEIKDGFVYGIVAMTNNNAGLPSGGKWGKAYVSFPPYGLLTKVSQAGFKDGKTHGKTVIPYLDPIIENLCPTIKPEDRKYMIKILPQEGQPPQLVPLEPEGVIRDVKEYIESGGEGPIFFGGSVQLFYYRFLIPALQKGLSIGLGEKGVALVGSGGWDGSKGTNQTPPIDKGKYIEAVQRVLGVPLKNTGDYYGTSENPLFVYGEFSPEYKDFIFKPPAWSRIFIRDPDNPERLIKEVGKKGKPHIIAPYGVDSYAGASILVNDLFMPLEFGEYGECLAFTGIGRGKGSSKGTSCGEKAAQLVGGSND
jgi:hypothetical protein